jgi:hypothetical protein
MDLLDHVFYGKPLLFFSETGVKDYLEEEVAQLVGEAIEVAGIDRVNDLISFLKKQAFERIDILGAVPGASFGAAEVRHEFHELVKFFADCLPSFSHPLLRMLPKNQGG